MRIIILAAIIISFSCNNSSPTYKKLSVSDSLIINFNRPQSDTIAKTISTTEKVAIKKLAGFIDSEASPAYKCGYNGNILFYDNGSLVADVAFNYGEGCRHFIQIISDQLSSTKMSNEAADFLQSLAEGKSWY